MPARERLGWERAISDVTMGMEAVSPVRGRMRRSAIFRTVQRFWENLPVAMREGAARRSKMNAGQMVFPEMDSEFRVVSAGDESAGRGITIQNLHCSEVARWPANAAETLAGLRAALTPEGESVLESTPCGAWGCFYDEWQRAESTGLVRHFLPWWLEEEYRAGAVDEESLSEEERALMAAHGLTLGQIGFRRSVAASYRGLAAQEFAEDAELCFKRSGECVFDVAAIETRLKEIAETPGQSERGVTVWLPPMPGREYVVGVDTVGGGADGDFAAIEVVDLETGMQCAELCERLEPRELAREARKLAQKYNQALLVVERNNHGAGVLAFLESAERYERVYGQSGQAGWLTTIANRPEMLARLGALLVERPGLFNSARLLGECRQFVRLRGGRTEAAAGGHDDCVLAMAIAQAVRAECRESGGI